MEAAVWLVEDGVPRCVPLPSSNLVPFGRWWHARGRENCRREPGGVPLGRYAPDSVKPEGSWSSTSQGSAEPLCARVKGAANGQDSWGVFQGCSGLWTAGCWLARRLHQLKASTTMALRISFFLILYDV